MTLRVYVLLALFVAFVRNVFRVSNIPDDYSNSADLSRAVYSAKTIFVASSLLLFLADSDEVERVTYTEATAQCLSVLLFGGQMYCR